MSDENDYCDTGPFCPHWSHPDSCDIICLTCGHRCGSHCWEEICNWKECECKIFRKEFQVGDKISIEVNIRVNDGTSQPIDYWSYLPQAPFDAYWDSTDEYGITNIRTFVLKEVERVRYEKYELTSEDKEDLKKAKEALKLANEYIEKYGDPK